MTDFTNYVTWMGGELHTKYQYDTTQVIASDALDVTVRGVMQAGKPVQTQVTILTKSHLRLPCYLPPFKDWLISCWKKNYRTMDDFDVTSLVSARYNVM